jgi:hypothetical protein
MKHDRLDNVVYPAAWDGRRPPPPTLSCALLSAFLAHPEFAACFEAACRSGAPAVRDMIRDAHLVVLLRGHVFTTGEGQFEEVGEALFDLAGELLPDSPGAVRKRLRERVAARSSFREPTCAEAIEALAASEYAAFDHLVAAAAHAELDEGAAFHAARHIWWLLCMRGQRYEPPVGIDKIVRAVIAAVFTESGEEQGAS